MINKGATFQPLFAIDGKEPAVGFLDGKIVYSKYVVFGTTYNTQDFTFPYAIRQNNVDVPHDWHVEVLGKAGTDPDNGDYYYCGLLNDRQDVESYQNPQNIISYFTGDGFQITKIRDILWAIPFGDFNNFKVMSLYGRGNTYLKSVDVTLCPRNLDGISFLNAFLGCTNLERLTGFADFCQALTNGANNFTNFLSGNAVMTVFDTRGYTKWYTVSSQFSIVANCSALTDFYLSESSQDNNNWVTVALNMLPLITDLDFAKFRFKKLSGINFAGNSAMRTLTGMHGLMFKNNTLFYQVFKNCYELRSDPEISTWVGEDGTSKPLISIANSSACWTGCGKNVPVADRNWEIDIRGWQFQLTQNAYQDNGGIGFALGDCLGNTNGYGVRIAGIKFLPYSTNTWVVIGFTANNNSFLDTVIDLDSMADSQYDIYLGNSILYQSFMNSPNITKVKFGRAQVGTYNGNIQSYAFTRTFQGATNLSDMDLRVKHINVYRNMWNAQQQQYETTLQPFKISDATAWVNSSQINTFIDDLVATQSEQYRVNNLKFEIQFNAAQRDIIQARPNWSTDVVTISNNGWELLFPVSVNGVWSNIDTSEMP